MSNTPPATDRVPHQPLEALGLQAPADSQELADSKEQASKVELIPSLKPCLPSTSPLLLTPYAFSLVSVLLRLPHCPPYSFITVHCSTTSPEQDVDVAEIRRWHKKKGWRDVGYHFVIRRKGDVQLDRPLS